MLQWSFVRVRILSWGRSVRAAWTAFTLSSVLNLSTGLAEEVPDAPKSEGEGEGDRRGEALEEASPAARFTAWSAPSSCIAIEELRSRVREQITLEPSVIREVRGEMLRGPAGWIVTFSVYDGDRKLGERLLELEGDACRTHDATLALVVALLLEHGPPPPPDEEPTPPGPPERPPVKSETPKAEEEPAPPAPPVSDEAELLRLRGGVGWGVISGWLPSLGFGPTGFVGAEVFEKAAVEVVGDYYLPIESTQFESASATMAGGRVHLRGCGLPKWKRWEAAVCAGFGWMGLSASGRDVPEPESALHGTLETSGSAALVYQLGSGFGLEIGGEVMAPFGRGRFVFAKEGGEVLVHDTGRVLFASHVGVVLTL